MPYVKAHAQEMSEEVMKKHIGLYVNEYSIDLGETGTKAVNLLFNKAKEIGLIESIIKPISIQNWTTKVTEFYTKGTKKKI